MRGKSLVVVLALAIVMLAAQTLAVSEVYATSPTTVNGILTVNMDYVHVNRQSGKSDNVFGTFVGTQYWEGAIEGLCVHEGFMKMGVNGWMHGTYTFESVTVTVGSVVATGGLTILGWQHGLWRIIEGTGELANLHGQGSGEYIEGVQYSYTGQLHFDP